jgi:hypothetical protein
MTFRSPRSIEAQVEGVVLKLLRARIEIVVDRVVEVRLDDVFLQHFACDRVDPIRRNLVVFKLRTNELRIRRTDRQRRIE